METTHSKTRRAKGSSPKIVIQSWDSVWDSFKKENTITTVKEMNAEGWKTIDQVMEISKLSNSRIYNMIREGLFDRQKKKVKVNGEVRILNFVRPKC